MPFTGADQFSVTYQPPSVRQPETDNPMMNTSFRFLMAKVPNVTYFCQRVNIPSLSLEGVEQPTRFGTRLFKAGDGYSYADLTVEFIVDEEMKNWLEIYNWLRSCHNLRDTTEYENETKHTTEAELIVLNSAYKGIQSVVFNDIIPTSIGEIQFDSSTNETEPIVAAATFKFSSYEIKKIT